MIKLLADENVAPRVIEALRKEKFDILSIQEVGLSKASDEKIIKFGQKEKRIIISHDKDFGKLIHQLYYKHGGVYFNKIKESISPKCDQTSNPFS
jgi:predicted nuclease of predicted toxin-antitoxin system